MGAWVACGPWQGLRAWGLAVGMTITDMGAHCRCVWGVTYLKCVKLALFGEAFPWWWSHSYMGAADGDRAVWLGAVLAMVVVMHGWLNAKFRH